MAVPVTESKYKSFMKPSRFWKSSPAIQQPEDLIDERTTVSPTKSTSYMPTFKFKKSSQNTLVALEESCQTEVYKLSTIDQTGLYMPPSPTLQGKKDHWIEVNEDEIMSFRLPSSECLTSHTNEKHDFFTPSSFVKSQPYVLPIADLSESTLSSVPSLDDDSQSDIM
ncbi:hypothetical protein A0J61_07569 [Choanephora cucurbitarum]|uniref:Uncharacterized protein n=1 Tax=Choanephora cucurbitarum TaxID=101091 RepID=A0A1C7NAI9_9FUNG|nr:hypothetical protein A0J61_07569 [Choanephora cucurbitarum]